MITNFLRLVLKMRNILGEHGKMLKADHECCSSVHIMVLHEARRRQYKNDEPGHKKQQRFTLKSAQKERVRG